MNGGAIQGDLSSWVDVSSNLPNIPVNGIVIDPDQPNTLYVATDIGVFASVDGGTMWAPLGSGLPRVTVTGLQLHRSTRILRAATHGRSMWDFQLPAPAAITATPSSVKVTYTLGAVAPAAQSIQIGNSGGGTLAWSANSNSSWLSATPSGTTPSMLTIRLIRRA